MNQILSFFNTLGSYLTPYLSDVSVAMIACALVMLGVDINRALRAFLAGKHFLIRTCAFIGINAFGYGLLIVKASPFLTSALRSIQPAFMLAIVFSTFIIIGIWAQKNRQV
ncbi:hypothetical protein BEI46_16005 [Aliivibrio fischeri]|uniref:DUF3392 domain-containing protein n=1 Tax=Aliivibrio fischeri TaxID=668 RepID=UPI00084BE41C|nr:DUF3392 domain-containing protein [Aliivibrio fischeri]OED54392.1 hypothetical protein BEI46_16005 [Aliivibrio fischeri]